MLPYNDGDLKWEDSEISIAKKAYPEVYARRAMTENEFRRFMATYREARRAGATAGNGETPDTTSTDGQGNVTATPAEPMPEEQESEATNPALWWMLGGAVLIAAAAVTTLLCIKPRKKK